jgi:hypothetical protein
MTPIIGGLAIKLDRMIREEYRMTLKNNLKVAFWTLLYLAIAPILLLILIISGDANDYDRLFTGFLLCFAGTALIWLPGSILYSSYYFNGRNKVVRLNKAELLLSNSKIERSWRYFEIKAIERVDNSCISRTLWGYYGFIKVIFENNEVVKINSLTANPETLANLLQRKPDSLYTKRCTGLPFLFT